MHTFISAPMRFISKTIFEAISDSENNNAFSAEHTQINGFINDDIVANRREKDQDQFNQTI